MGSPLCVMAIPYVKSSEQVLQTCYHVWDTYSAADSVYLTHTYSTEEALV